SGCDCTRHSWHLATIGSEYRSTCKWAEEWKPGHVDPCGSPHQPLQPGSDLNWSRPRDLQNDCAWKSHWLGFKCFQISTTQGVAMVRTRVHNLFVSSDGYAAGDHVTLEKPIGGAEALFGRFDGRVIHGIHGVDEPVTVDRAMFSMWGQGIGAEIMGRRKFGPQSGEWPDDGWEGWWGDEPPFLTPVFILTHYPRKRLEFANSTSFHFVDASPE